MTRNKTQLTMIYIFGAPFVFLCFYYLSNNCYSIDIQPRKEKGESVMRRPFVLILLFINLSLLGLIGCDKFSSHNPPVSGEVVGMIEVDDDEYLLIVHDTLRDNICYILQHGTRSKNISCLPNLEERREE